jgi:hypothetical protein
MSPRIDISVQSVGKPTIHHHHVHARPYRLTSATAYDEKNLLLYVHIFQIFRIWLVPFYAAPVELTTVLQLQRDKSDGKYYISSQNDLYQVDQWIKFLVPGGWALVVLWHLWATACCVVGTYLLVPVTWLEEAWGWGDGDNAALERQRGMSAEKREWRWLDGRSEAEVRRERELNGKITG